VHRFMRLELGQEQGIGDVAPQPGYRLAGFTDREAEEVIRRGGTLGQGGASRQQQGQPGDSGLQCTCQRNSIPSALPRASRSTLSR
jgi:hypothetical protein